MTALPKAISTSRNIGSMRETQPAGIETQIHQPGAAKQVEVHGRSRSTESAAIP
jgi:hypothetical protein